MPTENPSRTCTAVVGEQRTIGNPVENTPLCDTLLIADNKVRTGKCPFPQQSTLPKTISFQNGNCSDCLYNIYFTANAVWQVISVNCIESVESFVDGKAYTICPCFVKDELGSTMVSPQRKYNTSLTMTIKVVTQDYPISKQVYYENFINNFIASPDKIVVLQNKTLISETGNSKYERIFSSPQSVQLKSNTYTMLKDESQGFFNLVFDLQLTKSPVENNHTLKIIP